MTSIYDQHDAAFPNVSAFVIAKDGKRVATIAFKFGNAVTAYVHWLGEPMVRATANGVGYDRKSAACSIAARKLTAPNADDLIALNLADGYEINADHWREQYARRAGWKTADLTPGMLVNERLANPDTGQCPAAHSWAEAYARNHEDPDWRAFRDALTPDDGATWSDRLRCAGFDVWQAV